MKTQKTRAIKFIFTLPYFICLISLSGCQKEKDLSSGGEYYIRFKENGNQKDFRTQAFCVNEVNSIVTVFSGSAASHSNFAAPDVSSVILAAVFLAPAPETGKVYHASDEAFNITYDKNLGSETYESDYENDTELQFTELTATHIRGKFKGKVYLNSSGGTKTIQLTDGDFYLKRE